ncbi:MAG: hypothetical protein RLZZ336_874 [Cyanobacteriota bacterium]
MTAFSSLMVPTQKRPTAAPSRDAAPAADGQRLEQEAAQFDRRAQAAAEAGDIAEAAQLILRALDCERRLASRGPQILQLIKPRG